MGCITLTLDTDKFDANGTDIEYLIKDIQVFINLLRNASPDYVVAGDILQAQLDEQVQKLTAKGIDPKEQMQKYLDSVCPINGDSEIASAGFWQRYDELRSNIGEAMGPVSYAAFKLANYVEEYWPAYAKEHDAGTKWIWDFVKYYEEHWEF